MDAARVAVAHLLDVSWVRVAVSARRARVGLEFFETNQRSPRLVVHLDLVHVQEVGLLDLRDICLEVVVQHALPDLRVEGVGHAGHTETVDVARGFVPIGDRHLREAGRVVGRKLDGVGVHRVALGRARRCVGRRRVDEFDFVFVAVCGSRNARRRRGVLGLDRVGVRALRGLVAGPPRRVIRFMNLRLLPLVQQESRRVGRPGDERGSPRRKIGFVDRGPAGRQGPALGLNVPLVLGALGGTLGPALFRRPDDERRIVLEVLDLGGSVGLKGVRDVVVLVLVHDGRDALGTPERTGLRRRSIGLPPHFRIVRFPVAEEAPPRGTADAVCRAEGLDPGLDLPLPPDSAGVHAHVRAWGLGRAGGATPLGIGRPAAGKSGGSKGRSQLARTSEPHHPRRSGGIAQVDGRFRTRGAGGLAVLDGRGAVNAGRAISALGVHPRRLRAMRGEEGGGGRFGPRLVFPNEPLVLLGNAGNAVRPLLLVRHHNLCGCTCSRTRYTTGVKRKWVGERERREGKVANVLDCVSLRNFPTCPACTRLVTVGDQFHGYSTRALAVRVDGGTRGEAVPGRGGEGSRR